MRERKMKLSLSADKSGYQNKVICDVSGISPKAPMLTKASITDFETPACIWNSSTEIKSPDCAQE